MDELKIPYCLPEIGEEEIAEVVDTLRSGWLTMGPKTIAFEEQIAAYTGAKYAVAVNSCTAALHLSLLAYGIGPGDEVITSPYTFASTGNVIVHSGARPVFADIQRDTFNIDPEKINEAITSKTKAIVPVHFAGQPCDMKEIQEIADDHDLVVIEDAAHAIGAEYRGKKIGSLSDATCFSFYATKNMTTGEGGAVTTDDQKIADKMRILRLHGISKDAWKRYSAQGSWYYEIEDCGWKYNMTDIQAALGIHQLRKLNGFVETRRKYAEMYSTGLRDLEGVVTPVEKKGRRHVYHLYPILLNGMDRGDFIGEMANMGICCSVHFIPLHLHPFYRENYGLVRGDYPLGEGAYDHEVSLPLYPAMQEETIRHVIRCVHEILK
ncbi:DegT/DnrJ/EryC1/StrS family aminotransferase [Methanofollis sp. UBA420]|jgi:UDP-4-amino-4,6-dideoxy-N-acetyl-beta-L-altrosamine transaminase|uniref:DegT/DnrJ/EryC1/StrS family aminotransferase n=1 Tax=Methanofollis sp. UBA420 TaxID=1915514 RepID=UPI00316ABDB9